MLTKDDPLRGIASFKRDCPMCERKNRIPRSQITAKSKWCKLCNDDMDNRLTGEHKKKVRAAKKEYYNARLKGPRW